MRSPSRIVLAAVLLFTAATTAGCLSAPELPELAKPSTAASSSSPPASASAAACNPDSVRQSYRSGTGGDSLTRIRARGFLVAGVAADVAGLGAVSQSDLKTFEGFDIEMVRAVARKIWPDATSNEAVDKRIRFKVITAARRIELLKTPVNEQQPYAGGVDLVARAFTITCDRWTQIAFSEPYLVAHLKLLVPRSLATGSSPVKDLATLQQQSPTARICAPKGSTSFAPLAKYPQLVKVEADTNTECLALLREGRVDALISDDAILAGLAAQDPQSQVINALAAGDTTYDQPYGLGMNAQQIELVVFVNGVLEGLRAGGWQSAYTAWLEPKLRDAGPQQQPAAALGRPLPGGQ